MDGILYWKKGVYSVEDASHTMIASYTNVHDVAPCLHGDKVTVHNEKVVLKERAHYIPIVGVLELRNKTHYGLTSRGHPLYLFRPYNESYPNFVVGCSQKDLSKNLLVLITVSEWNYPMQQLPRGIIRTILGICGNYEAEKQAIFWHYSPYVIPKELKEIKQTHYDVSMELTCRVKTPQCTFHIDPVGCKDVDDVLSIVQIAPSLWEIWISISDVSAYIGQESPLDIYAKLQGTTTYDNDGVVLRSMLPESLSTGCCSLLPGNDHLGVSLVLQFDGKNVLDISWKLVTVTNVESYNYENVYNANHLPLDILESFTSYYFQTQDIEIVNDSHKWVEACMLFYNKMAAQLFASHQKGVLRAQKEADVQKLKYFQAYNIIDLEKYAQNSAYYCDASSFETYHASLQLGVYCHATSPIRRYVDLVNQRVLKEIIQKEESQPYIVNYNHLNQVTNAHKKLRRDLHYARCIMQDNDEKITMVVLEIIQKDEHSLKLKCWVPSWDTVISWKTLGKEKQIVVDKKYYYKLEIGSHIDVQYYCDYQKFSWKQKMNYCLHPQFIDANKENLAPILDN